MVTFLLFFLAVRNFHPVTIASFAECGLTHVSITAVARNTRHERDGDWVFDFQKGTALVHVEIIPEFPLMHPRSGQCVTVTGIRRFDDENAPGHHHWEIHPVLSIKLQPTRKCP